MLKNPLDTQSRVHFKTGEHLFSQDKDSASVCSTNFLKKTLKYKGKSYCLWQYSKLATRTAALTSGGWLSCQAVDTHLPLQQGRAQQWQEQVGIIDMAGWVSADTFQQHLRAQTPEQWSKGFICVLQLGLAFRADKNTARNMNIWYNTSQHGKQPRQTLLEIKLDWGSKAGEKQSQVWTQKAFQLKVIRILAMEHHQ